MLKKVKTEVYALGQHISMSAHKARRVINQIRGRSYEETLMILELMPYRACYPIFKLVYSAAANASYNMGSNEANLVISKAEVNEGTTVKRLKPRARGRSYPIKRPTCHITIVMKDISLDEYIIEDFLNMKYATASQKSKQKKKYTAMAYPDMYRNGGAWDKK
uniref:ribosomal protein L22 n=1 Tax=Pentaphragma spicatum TaxID=2744234 RepID=UPI0025A9D896|nr:ribosomal protein L22 [Pentaphragma spicatum]WIW75633.1 ribosomal protein L22 [Pentaphragma spicatum]